jgi:ElaB/YqjD/DUF883 family membrane-anchored ribosome-binding protein
MKSRYKNEKLHEVLEILNEAAKEKKAELYELIGEKYSTIAHALSDKAENGKHAVGKAKKQLIKTLQEEEERLLDKAKEVDRQAHENPWAFIGTVAFVSFLFGMRFGSRSDRARSHRPAEAAEEDNHEDEKA